MNLPPSLSAAECYISDCGSLYKKKSGLDLTHPLIDIKK